MRVLLVKTSSLGDILHTLPAVSDAQRALPGLTLTWLVEEAFAPLPSWHGGVTTVMPVALRRWRRHPWRSRHEARDLIQRLRQEPYDRVIDAQGLLKSALLATLAQGPRWGPGRDWARETLACRFYRHQVGAAHLPHVVERLRHLLAQALDYPTPATPPDFGLTRLPAAPTPSELAAAGVTRPFLLFLHGTAWSSKEWPETSWITLAREAATLGTICLPWGNDQERQRAERIRQATGGEARVLPAMGLTALAGWLGACRGVVGLDSGLAHLAGAMGKPCVTLFGATNPDYSGVAGPRQRFLRANFPCAPCMKRQCERSSATPPCFTTLPPQRVLETLNELLETIPCPP